MPHEFVKMEGYKQYRNTQSVFLKKVKKMPNIWEQVLYMN